MQLQSARTNNTHTLIMLRASNSTLTLAIWCAVYSIHTHFTLRAHFIDVR